MSKTKTVTLENCFFLRARIGWQGLRSDEFIDAGPYLVTGTDFINGRVNWDTCYHVTMERYAQDKGIQLHEHDLLITKDGTIGKTAVVYDCPEKVTLNSGVFVVRAINNDVVPEYLYYVLMSHDFELYLRNIMTGSTIKHLNQEHFYKFSFTVPSDTKEQAKIAEVLSTVDEAIDRTREIIEKYKNIKAGLMQDLLVEGEEVTLGETRYFTINPRTRKLPDTFCYIDLESVISGAMVKLDIVRAIDAPSRAQRLVEAGDVLFQLVRPYQQNNYFFDKPLDLPAVASTGYAQIRTTQCPKFIYYALHENSFLKGVIARCSGSNYPAINTTELKRVILHLPSIERQKEIASQLSAADERINVEDSFMTKLQDIKLGLMQDLLTQKVSVAPLM